MPEIYIEENGYYSIDCTAAVVNSFEQIEMNRAIGAKDIKSIGEVRKLIKKYNPDRKQAIELEVCMCPAF